MSPPPPSDEPPGDDRATRAAAFLIQALGLGATPADLAPELVHIRDDATIAVYTAELDSSVGPAAFVVYVYSFDGSGGREPYDTALRTLQEAAARDAPGPRLLASASSGPDGFLLATTPATFRALGGEAESTHRAAVDRTAPVGHNPTLARREAAAALLGLLRDADASAATWLAAVRAGDADATSGAAPAAPGPDEEIVFDEVETELALFLMDEPGIQQLLRVVNLFLIAARRQAAQRPGLPPAPPTPT